MSVSLYEDEHSGFYLRSVPIYAARKPKASRTCTLAWNAVFLPNANDKSSSRDYAVICWKPKPNQTVWRS